MAEWAAMLRIAVAMGVTPGTFWRLSWREWLWLTTAPGGQDARTQAMERDALDDLMRRFPDR